MFSIILLWNIISTNVFHIIIGPNSAINNGESTYNIANETGQNSESQQQNNNSTDLKNLNEEFDSLNLESLWSHDIYIAQDPVCNT